MSVMVGDRIPVWSHGPVTPERMALMAAILRDPNPIHFEPATTGGDEKGRSAEKPAEGMTTNQDAKLSAGPKAESGDKSDKGAKSMVGAGKDLRK